VVHEAVTDAGLEAPVVVGHSLGGALATAYVAGHAVSGIVNVDQPLLVGGFRDVLRKAEPVLRGPDYLQVWQQMLANMHIDLLPDAMQDLVRTASTPRQDLLLGYWDEILTASSAEELTGDWTRRLGSIASRGVPYHQVNGDELPLPYREWLTSVLPGVTITVLPGSGHFVHLAHPAELAKLLLP
jgi:pimeloyl-ACP methyl ester carboxylesterase